MISMARASSRGVGRAVAIVTGMLIEPSPGELSHQLPATLCELALPEGVCYFMG